MSCNLLVTRLVTGSCPMWFIYRESIGGMWFLRTLFTCYLYAWLFLRLYGALWLKIIGSIVLALFFPHGYYLQFNYMIIFFWLGFVMKRYDSLLKTHRGGAFVISIVVFILVPWHGPAVLTYDVLLNHPLQLPIQFLGGLAGSILTITFMMLICRISTGRWIEKLADGGRYTLAIYGLHDVLLVNISLCANEVKSLLSDDKKETK